jgi:hypothetical protein
LTRLNNRRFSTSSFGDIRAICSWLPPDFHAIFAAFSHAPG